MHPFHGLSAFPITPSDPDGRVRPTDLRSILRRIADAQVDSVGVLGSTGGYAYLDPDQRRAAVEATMDEIGGRLPVIVGVGALRTDVAQSLARHAEASDLPICIYNNPTTTHSTFSTDVLARLAAVLSIRAVKMPLPANGEFAGEIATLRTVLPPGFSIGYSGDWGCARAMLAGADAFYSVAAGTWPAEMLRLLRAAQSGDVPETARIDQAFAAMWALFKASSSFRTVHRGANLLGLSDAQPPRPILPLPDAKDSALRHALDALAAV